MTSTFDQQIRMYRTVWQVANGEASQVANEAIGSITTVASFCAEAKVMEMYQMKSEAPLKQGVKNGLIDGVSFGSSNFCLYALTFYLGVMTKQSFLKFLRYISITSLL